MKRFFKDYIAGNHFFWVFSISGLLLLVASFILPPLGTIDNSVLAGVGEIDVFIALGCVVKAIDKGVGATFQHNNTSVTITNKDEEEEGDDE